jgi:hypothetical protein
MAQADTVATFHSIATDATKDMSDPEPETGQAATEAAPVEDAQDTAKSEESATTEASESPAESAETPGEDYLPLDLRGYDRDTIPDELKPTYDRLVDAYKSMQSGLTPKLQEGAKAKEERDVLASQVEALSARIEALTGQQGQADPAAWLTAGLKGISWADVKRSDDPDMYAEWVREQAVIEGRRAANEVIAGLVGVLSPRLMAVENTVGEFTAEQSRVAVRQVEAFFKANPDVEPHRLDIATLIEAGLAEDIEDATEKVRAMKFGPEREAKVLAAALEAAKVRSKTVEDNQEQFSVPAASTSPKGAPRFTSDESFQDIARKAAAGLG